MNEEELIPALDAVYQMDQARLAKLHDQVSELQKLINGLEAPIPQKEGVLTRIEFAQNLNRHNEWRAQEVIRLKRMIYDLAPEIDEAKQMLAVSFGRLEALRAIITEMKN
ncbi:hypothetical protein [uncultured Litoreibacter sp.]|uniref:hypothetical protein n=1 Tax=uncultured Litoreibacter sp. TaxID=1392394 RepID=UPI00260DD2CC|nr:hypothetical protein [uncultured Litoreibacter sp.]